MASGISLICAASLIYLVFPSIRLFLVVSIVALMYHSLPSVLPVVVLLIGAIFLFSQFFQENDHVFSTLRNRGN